MKKITILTILALAAGCSTKKDEVAPHLVVNAKFDQGITLANGEANPSLNLSISGTCLGASTEDSKSETLQVAAGATETVELCSGDFNISVTATDNWEGVCPTSFSLGERTDHSVDCIVKRKVTAASNQAILDAIAALQAAINGGDPASVASALANLLTAINGVNGAVGALQSDIDALRAQALRILYPGSVHFTVLSNSASAIANAVCTETNVEWAKLPAGENSPRTCTTNASGECEVSNLYLDRALRFRCEAVSYMAESNINVMLTSGTPSQAWEVRLAAAGANGDLLWQNFTVANGASRTITGSVYQVQSDGSLKAVSAADGLTCTISAGPNMVNVDVDCTLLSGLAVGCGQATANLGGKSVLSKVRVTGTGAPATCP